MTRREWLAWGGGALARGAQARRPNVLMIAVDDLRPSFGCYGNPGIRSPNLDRLAASGMRFDHAYCQQAVCAPSRASLLSGTRPDTTRIYDLQTPLRKNLPDVLTLPQFFRQNGYETVALGKIYHHTQDDPEGWSVKPWVPPGNWTGKAAYLDPASLRAMEERDARLAAGMRAGMGPAFERPYVTDDDYPDGKTATHAIGELRRLRNSPFFLATGFYKPHLPFNAPKKYWDLYAPRPFPAVTQPDWPAGSPEVARSDWGELRSFAGMPATGPVSPDLARPLVQGYAACGSLMAAQGGRGIDRTNDVLSVE